MNRSISAWPYWVCFLGTVVFLVAVSIGAYYTQDKLIPFFLQRPNINGFILFVGLVGLVLSLFELIRGVFEAHRLRGIFPPARSGGSSKGPYQSTSEDDGRQGASSEAGPMEGLQDRSDADKIEAYKQRLSKTGGGMVNQRLAAILAWADERPESIEEISLILSQADSQSVDNRGMIVSYLLGVMVFLGLLGTFWGLLITVQGVNDVLATLEPESIEDPASFLEQLKTSMGGMLGGMATAFSTSLFGLGGSLILGFAEMTARRSRSQLLVDLDKAVANNIVPLMVKDQGGSEISLRRIVKNTESLPGMAREVITQGRNLTESLNKIAHLLERPRDAGEEMEGIRRLISESANELHTASDSLGQISQNLSKPLLSFQESSDALLQEISETRNTIETLGANISESMAPVAEVSDQVSAVFEDNRLLRERMDLVYELGLEKLQEEVERRRKLKSQASQDSGDSLIPTEPEDQE